MQSYLNYLLGNNIDSIYDINNSKTALKNIKTNEQKIFYYNSQGIINMKLKKYSFSKHYFKLGINLYKSIHNNLNTSNSIYYNDTVINKIEYLYKMEFNLGLSCFYNENYSESYEIFNRLKNVPYFKNNVYLWFRLGLSSLNLYLISIRKLKQKQKKYYQNLNRNKFEDENNNENEQSNNDYFIYESSSDNSIIELIEEYKKEYELNESYNETNISNDDNINLIKIFLEPHIRFDDKNNYNYYNNYLNDKNDIDKYLESSIISFKKVLRIYKKYDYIDEINEKRKDNLRGIFNFYTKNIGETKEFKSLLNNQIINKKNFVSKNLIYSCYLNLLFAYNLKEKYLEMILMINYIKKEKIYQRIF